MNLSDEQRKIVRSDESGIFQINVAVGSRKILNDNLRILKIEDVCRNYNLNNIEHFCD